MMNKIDAAALETVTGGIIWPKQKETRTLLAAAPEGMTQKMRLNMRLDMRLDAVSAPWVRRFIDF